MVDMAEYLQLYDVLRQCGQVAGHFRLSHRGTICVACRVARLYNDGTE